MTASEQSERVPKIGGVLRQGRIALFLENRALQCDNPLGSLPIAVFFSHFNG